MAISWPDKKVALDIIDDPASDSVGDRQGWAVVRVTLAQLNSRDGYRAILRHVAKITGKSAAECDRAIAGPRHSPKGAPIAKQLVAQHA